MNCLFHDWSEWSEPREFMGSKHFSEFSSNELQSLMLVQQRICNRCNKYDSSYVTIATVAATDL
jgi:hypothetical protein